MLMNADIIIFLTLCLTVAVSSSWFPRIFCMLAILCCNAVLLYESMLGFFQVVGWKASRHALFALTGSFDNPGPYGGFIAVTSAISFAYIIRFRHRFSYHWIALFRRTNRIKMVIPAVLLYGSAAAFSMGLCILPASMSRSSWIAFAFGILMAAAPLIRREKSVLRLTRWRVILTLCIICSLLFVSVWFFKRDSAMGRLHIWRIECLAIAEHPLFGSGPGMGAFGNAQEHFFEKKTRPLSVIQIAGCPEYAFNEYLAIGMWGGIPAILIAILTVIVAIVRLRQSFPEAASGMLAYAVFAWGSYPLSVPLLRILLAVLLGLSLSSTDRIERMFLLLSTLVSYVVLTLTLSHHQDRYEAERCWHNAQFLGQTEQYDRQANVLITLYPQLRKQYRFLYDLGYALHKGGRYNESSRYLEEGLSLSSDPMFLNILGKNCEAIGDDPGAEAFYLRSIHRVPCRLYPRLLLIRLYRRTGRKDLARSQAEEALALPVSDHHLAMQWLHEEIQNELDSLNQP